MLSSQLVFALSPSFDPSVLFVKLLAEDDVNLGRGTQERKGREYHESSATLLLLSRDLSQRSAFEYLARKQREWLVKRASKCLFQRGLSSILQFLRCMACFQFTTQTRITTFHFLFAGEQSALETGRLSPKVKHEKHTQKKKTIIIQISIGLYWGTD